ncbi:MAG: PhnD/SsuA/transferrin family substrate-binding protein [Pseudomonadales bacterium]
MTDTQGFASLPWYDTPGQRAQLDQLWQLIREQISSAQPIAAQLNRHSALEQQWRSSQLVLSQCCGPDLFTSAGAQLEVLARPIFSHLACTPGAYFSYIVRCRNNRQHTVIAVNSMSSRSGCSAAIDWLKKQQINDYSLIISGSHQASLDMLRAGTADLAAIDAHSWEILDTDDIDIIDRSAEALTPPFVYHPGCGLSQAHLFDALQHAINVAGKSVGISGIIRCDRQHYHCMRRVVHTLATPSDTPEYSDFALQPY